MKEYNLHFYSASPCNIYINGELVGIIDNQEKFFIDLVVFTNQLIVTCEPISTKQEMLIPYSFKLNYINNKLLSSVTNAKIIPFPNSHYDVILNFKSVALNNKTSLINKKLSHYNILVMVDNTSTISIFNNDENLFSTEAGYLQNLNFEQIGSLIFVTAECKNEYYLLIFNTKDNEVLINDYFIKIEKANNEIKALKSLNNSLKHGKVYVVDLNENNVTSYSVYLQDYSIAKQQNLIPLNFLDAIKAEDYKLAKTFLDDTFKDVTDEKLKQYFDNFNEVYYNCYYLKDNVYNYTICGSSCKNFNFYLHNNKITEIEEVTLD